MNCPSYDGDGNADYTLLFLGGRHPLCGSGVMSLMEITSIPFWEIERMAPSLPEPGPFTYTSTRFRPASDATLAASAAAICAAYGVFFLEPRKPILPAEDQEITWPCLLVKAIMMLLNVAEIRASPAASTLTILFLVVVLALFCGFTVLAIFLEVVFVVNAPVPVKEFRWRIVMNENSNSRSV